MTPERFWHHYTHDDIDGVYDMACDFFQAPIDADSIDEFDFPEVILELSGHLNATREHDKLLVFINIIKKKQPKLYNITYPYLENDLVNYHCFHGNSNEIEPSIEKLKNNPSDDYDMFSKTYSIILYNGYTHLIEKIIAQNYDKLKRDEEQEGTAQFDMAMTQFAIELERAAQVKHDAIHFSREHFAEKLEDYDFSFSDKALACIDRGFHHFHFANTDFAMAFKQNIQDEILSVESAFLTYMKKHGFPFAVSDKLWNLLQDHLYEKADGKKLTPEQYFAIDADLFDEYLQSVYGESSTPDMVAALWGSVYAYDFLKHKEIISDRVYKNAILAIRKLKAEVICNFTTELWYCNFIHRWTRPESVPGDEFEAEASIFTRSYSMQPDELDTIEEAFGNELNKMGEMANVIRAYLKESNNADID